MSLLDVCHCCLAEDCTAFLSTKYYDNNSWNIYYTILSNTLNIRMPEYLLKGKICDKCICELKKVAAFKKQVEDTINVITMKYKMDESNFDKYESNKGDNLDCNDFDDKNIVNFECSADVDDHDFFIKPETNDNEDIRSMSLTKDVTRSKIKINKKEREKQAEDNGRNEDVILKNLQNKLDAPQRRSELIENSLKLVLNSNLCLFKSLKTKSRCYNCAEAFFTIKELRDHTNTHTNYSTQLKAKLNRLKGLSCQNADISNLKCKQCSQTCLDLNELKKHLTEMHGVHFGNGDHFIIPYRLENGFDCVVCGDKFNTYMRLSVHMNTHYFNNVCEICGSTFINRTSLRIHVHSRHREKKCRLCSEIFLSNYDRVKHMRKCHNTSASKRYCLVCGETFRYTYQLVEHRIQKHGAERLIVKCSLCPTTFPSTQNLKIHIRSVHVKERNFPCNICNMGFFTKSGRTRHERSHVDVRSFSCSHCESKFKSKDSVRRHIKRLHGHLKLG